MKLFCVYILANKERGTLYTGVTSNLKKRVWEHKNKVLDGFTKEHNLDKLVWYETHNEPRPAFTREKQIKNWNREWKFRIIEEFNPLWEDLYDKI